MNITIADNKLALESSLQDIESPMFGMYNTHHIYMRARTAIFHHNHPKKRKKERKEQPYFIRHCAILHLPPNGYLPPLQPLRLHVR